MNPGYKCGFFISGSVLSTGYVTFKEVYKYLNRKKIKTKEGEIKNG